jgi:hypothetical protein
MKNAKRNLIIGGLLATVTAFAASYNVDINYSSGGASVEKHQSIAVTIAGTNYSAGVMTVTNGAPTFFPFGNVTLPGFAYFRSLDTTGLAVSLGSGSIGASTNSAFVTLQDGQWSFGPLASNSVWAMPTTVSNISINVEFLILPK